MAVVTPVPDGPATRQQIRVEVHLLQALRSEREWPCDRYSPGWVSAPPVGGRHGLPGDPRYTARVPDSLQIVPDLDRDGFLLWPVGRLDLNSEFRLDARLVVDSLDANYWQCCLRHYRSVRV